MGKIELKSSAKKINKEKEEMIKQILQKPVNELTTQDFYFSDEKDYRLKLLKKVLNKFSQLNLEGTIQNDISNSISLPKIIINFTDSNDNLFKYIIEIWNEFFLFIIYKNGKVKEYIDNFTKIGEIIEYFENNNLLKENLKSRVDIIKKEREEKIVDVLKKPLEEINDNDLNLITLNLQNIKPVDLGSGLADFSLIKKLYEKIKEYFNNIGINVIDKSYSKYPGLLFTENEFSSEIMMWVTNGKILIKYKDFNHYFYDMKSFIKTMIASFKPEINKISNNINLLPYKRIKENKLNIKSRANEIQKEKANFINSKPITKENFYLVLDDEYNPQKEIIELVTDEKKQEIIQISEKIKEQYKKIKLNEEKVRNIIDREGLLKNNITINPDINDEEWFGLNKIFFGYYWEFDIEIIAEYNIEKDNLSIYWDAIKYITGDNKKRIDEQNSELEGKEFTIPSFVKEEIKNKQIEYGMSTKRSKYLLNQNTISYYEIKRLKNFFDNNSDGVDFYLAGGNEMKGWVNNILNQYRGQIHNKKKILYDIGLDNQFKKTHTKDNNKFVKPELGVKKIPLKSRSIFYNLSENEKIENKGENFIKIYEDSDILIINVKDSKTAKCFSKNTKWCSQHENGFINHFLKEELFRIIFKNKNRKLRLNIDLTYSGRTGTWGLDDKNYTISFFKNNPKNITTNNEILKELVNSIPDIAEEKIIDYIKNNENKKEKFDKIWSLVYDLKRINIDTNIIVINGNFYIYFPLLNFVMDINKNFYDKSNNYKKTNINKLSLKIESFIKNGYLPENYGKLKEWIRK
jgi:hypothetical protein